MSVAVAFFDLQLTKESNVIHCVSEHCWKLHRDMVLADVLIGRMDDVGVSEGQGYNCDLLRAYSDLDSSQVCHFEYG